MAFLLEFSLLFLGLPKPDVASFTKVVLVSIGTMLGFFLGLIKPDMASFTKVGTVSILRTPAFLLGLFKPNMTSFTKEEAVLIFAEIGQDTMKPKFKLYFLEISSLKFFRFSVF